MLLTSDFTLVLKDQNNSWGAPVNIYTIQLISTKMYDVFFTKMLQGSDTASWTVLQKRCSAICGLNPGLIYLTKSF